VGDGSFVITNIVKAMTHTYIIEGLTCGGCVTKAKSALLSLGDVTEAEVQLTAPQATITMQRHISTAVLQESLNKAGHYTITEADGGMHKAVAHGTGLADSGEQITWLSTYKPILLIGAYILGGTLLVEAVNDGFAWERWMNNFMAAFFLVFSFFKLLDVNAFADSYSTYDILAKRWRGWGLVYPYVELLLGIAYLIRFNPLLTNGVTFVVMGVSIIGVLQSVLRKQKIRCACLGAVFNLPMSTITIVEDALMIGMSAAMLIMI
jgi:copper chaperone CopZ